MTAVAEPRPLSGAVLWATAFAVGAGTFMQVVDVTIANVSLPTIAGNLGVSPAQTVWISTSFQIATAIVLPLTGWLMGRYGSVKCFVGATLVFTLASLLCGIAWDIGSLVAFRTIQGAACGLVMPGSQTILILIFPPHKRSTALAIWSFVGVIAPVFGPLLGGYISDNFHWGWIFLINVPVGLACVAICARNLRGHETATQRLPIDTTGLVLLAIWVSALQLLIDLGRDADWFESPMICALAVIGTITFLAFMIWELTEDHPIVDLSLFRNRNFTLGTLAYCIGSFLILANVVLLPMWLQTKLSYTAMLAGLVLLPSGLASVVATPLVNRFGRVDARVIATLSFLFLAASYYMRARFTANADMLTYSLPLIMQGLAFVTFYVSMVTIILSDIDVSRMAAASGISNFGRTAAGAFGASLVITSWDWRAAIHQSSLVGGAGSNEAALGGAMATLGERGLNDVQAVEMMRRAFDSQAHLLSAIDIFWFSTLLALSAIPLIWFTKVRRSPGAPITVAAD